MCSARFSNSAGSPSASQMPLPAAADGIRESRISVEFARRVDQQSLLLYVFHRKLSPSDASREHPLRQNTLIAPQAHLPPPVPPLLHPPMAYVNHVCHRAR